MIECSEYRRKLFKLVVRLLCWYIGRVKASWSRELHTLEKQPDKWRWIALCILVSAILLIYLCTTAFHLGWLLGLSFVWSAFWAVSFARILKNPAWLALPFVASVLDDGATNLFKAAKDAALAANFVGAVIAVILFFVGIYLMTWANRLEEGKV